VKPGVARSRIDWREGCAPDKLVFDAYPEPAVILSRAFLIDAGCDGEWVTLNFETQVVRLRTPRALGLYGSILNGRTGVIIGPTGAASPKTGVEQVAEILILRKTDEEQE